MTTSTKKATSVQENISAGNKFSGMLLTGN